MQYLENKAKNATIDKEIQELLSSGEDLPIEKMFNLYCLDEPQKFNENKFINGVKSLPSASIGLKSATKGNLYSESKNVSAADNLQIPVLYLYKQHPDTEFQQVIAQGFYENCYLSTRFLKRAFLKNRGKNKTLVIRSKHDRNSHYVVILIDGIEFFRNAHIDHH